MVFVINILMLFTCAMETLVEHKTLNVTLTFTVKLYMLK